jgi:flagellar protein FlaG
MSIQAINNQATSLPATSSGSPPAVTGANNATQPGTAPASASAPSPEQLNNAVKVINQVMQQSNQALEFSIDSSTKIPVVTLTDTQTGEVIRQFPSKETLAISQSIDQYQRGLLLTQKA